MYRTSIKTCEQTKTTFGDDIVFVPGGPYNDKKDPLPVRWRAVPESYKKPQWIRSDSTSKPFGRKGYFSAPEHAKVVKSRGGDAKEIVDDYGDKTSYSTAARPKHGVAFGSNDAKRRDQYTMFFEQERYREMIRREKKFTDRELDSAGDEEAKMSEAEAAAETLRAAGEGRKWGPARKMGTFSTAADDIGFGMDDVKFTSPRRGKVSTMQRFSNTGHLGALPAGAL